jgi:hypothetical protein
MVELTEQQNKNTFYEKCDKIYEKFKKYAESLPVGDEKSNITEILKKYENLRSTRK